MDWQDIRNLGSAATVATAALHLAEKIRGPKPALRVKVKCTGGGNGVDFTASVSETANRVPALAVRLFVELDDVDAPVFESDEFDLSAGELNRAVRFSLRRPEHGTLVKECNDAPTLYGRELTVTAFSEDGGVDSTTWREIAYDPETDAARYEAMQRVWREHGR